MTPTAQHSAVISTGYTPRPWQREVHRKAKRNTVVVAHRRSGKSVAAVNLLIAAACRTPNGRYGYVAPFVSQSRRVAWPYVHEYARPLPGVVFNETLATATLPNGASIALYGADNPDSLRGLGFDGVVLDEVADLKPGVWGTIVRPALADKQGFALFIGTPRGLNLFSNLYHAALRDPSWFAVCYPVTKTDALPAEEIEQCRLEMTEAEFEQELMCSFEAAVADALISLDVARAAAARKIDPRDYHVDAKVLGVDVARYGNDNSVIVKRQGLAMHTPNVLADVNTMQLASVVAQTADRWEAQQIFVDVGGIGAGVADRLTQLGFPVLEVEFGSKPGDPRFSNKRSEIWTLMAEWLAHASIPDDERLVADLVAPKFSYRNARGRLELEQKDSMKRRGLPSPDIADALACTFACPVPPPGLEARHVTDHRESSS